MEERRKRPGTLQLIVKGVLFFSLFFSVIFVPDDVRRLGSFKIGFFRVYHVLWLLAMAVVVKRFFPSLNDKVTSGKIYLRHYRAAGEDGEEKRRRLRRYLEGVDRGALRSAVYWSVVIVGAGLFSVAGILDELWLFGMSCFFVFMDQFCVTVWCPFKRLMGTKCCNTCRINNWGYFMAFSPLIFIPSPWTWSLAAVSALAVIQWEYLYFKHPERFSEIYNVSLACKNCESEGCTR